MKYIIENKQKVKSTNFSAKYNNISESTLTYNAYV